MNVAAIASQARTMLRRTLYAKTCTRQAAASAWANSGTFACHYEPIDPEAGVALDYDGSTGYGMTVYWHPDDATILVTDRIKVDGLTLKAQVVEPRGGLDGAKTAHCVVL